MTSFPLKDYQRECLEVLSDYLKDARASVGKGGAEVAFNRLAHERKPRAAYQVVKGWRESAEFPYICIRVPTGGGKTLMAAHAVGLATKHYLHADRSVVLWMAPSERIVSQTMKQLEDRGHPVRKALMEALGGQIEILSLEAALYVPRAVLDGATAIIVSTIQAWRVEGKEGRKVYQPDNGALMPHFDGVPPALLRKLEASAEGSLFYSLANVLRIRKPVVIADEAHHFRTKLSFDTLKRFDPAAIIEFTATPYGESKDRVPANVLVEATASDLKSEEMIKAPVVLKETDQWRDAVRLAVSKRNELERLATAEQTAGGDYVRPVMLLQAEAQYADRKTVTVDVLRDFLVNEERISAEQVVVHTGDEKGLPDDILAPTCPVRYVVTVQALREGWDCPFAYVLCTVSTVTATTAVEQILGRVLRMPYARRRGAEALNQAYCYTSRGEFGAAVQNLRDALVQAGFGKDEAEQMVTVDTSPRSRERDSGPGLFGEPVTVRVEEAPSPEAVRALPSALRDALSIERSSDGAGAVVVWSGGPLEERDAAKLAAVLNTPTDPTAGERVRRRSWKEDASPSAMGLKLVIPGLAVPDEHAAGGFALFESQHSDTPWTLKDCNGQLDGDDFTPAPVSVSTSKLDVDQDGQWRDRYEGELREAVLWQDTGGPKSLDQLAVWLDREVFDISVTQSDKRAFIDGALAYLTTRRGLGIENLAPSRWQLANALSKRIDSHRLRQERREYQRILDGLAAVPRNPEPEAAFDFTRAIGIYPALRQYVGPKHFEKHYYGNTGDMNDEEALCAQLIDSHPNVRTWVRNLERETHAFWLPKAAGRFYPDFVALLKDGRFAVIEHKGEDRAENPDELEKKALGELYEARSDGRCVFVWTTLSTLKRVLDARLAPR